MKNINSDLEYYRLPIFPNDVQDKISDIFSGSQVYKENNNIDNNLTFNQFSMDKHQGIIDSNSTSNHFSNNNIDKR